MIHSTEIVILMCMLTGTLAVHPCDLNCGSGDQAAKNTLCEYCPPGPNKSCGSIIESGLSNSESNDILDYHNELRRKVAKGKVDKQPEGSLMYKLMWSNQIAKAAERWVEQCQEGHDKCRRTYEFEHVGQNYAQMVAPDKTDYKKLVKLWFDEVQQLSSNNFQFDENTGHYTQLAWSKTTHIGCAGIVRRDGNNQKTELYCNYGPGGNVQGESFIYPSGTQCSKCVKDGEYCDDGLCVCGASAECNIGESYVDATCNYVYDMKWILMVLIAAGAACIAVGIFFMIKCLKKTKE